MSTRSLYTKYTPVFTCLPGLCTRNKRQCLHVYQVSVHEINASVIWKGHELCQIGETTVSRGTQNINTLLVRKTENRHVGSPEMSEMGCAHLGRVKIQSSFLGR